ERDAYYLGVDTERAKWLLMIAASLMVGAAVAATGIIAFVGLVVPHLARLVTGADRGLGVELAGRPVLCDVGLQVRSGEVLAVLGRNGAGKTTLVRALAGDLRPATGEVRLDGRPLSAWSPRALACRR